MRNTNNRFAQGLYVPKFPEKYIGRLDRIVYRSSWELDAFQFFDRNINIYKWCSEPFAIPYIKPTDGRLHKYYPDFYVEYRNKRGDYIREVIEVKPASQMRPSRAKRSKTRLTEDITYAINQAKWAAATEWCNQRGLVFRIVNENGLFKG